MQNLANGLFVSGRPSETEYNRFIQAQLDKACTLLTIAITRDCDESENDALVRTVYNALTDLYGKLESRCCHE